MKLIEEWTNKAMLAIGGVLLTGSLSLMGIGLWAYANAIYVQQVQFVDERIAEIDRKIYEVNEIFITVDQLDPITARRLGANKAWAENQKADLLRKREDLTR